MPRASIFRCGGSTTGLRAGLLRAGGAPLQWRVFSYSSGPRASDSLMTRHWSGAPPASLRRQHRHRIDGLAAAAPDLEMHARAGHAAGVAGLGDGLALL